MKYLSHMLIIMCILLTSGCTSKNSYIVEQLEATEKSLETVTIENTSLSKKLAAAKAELEDLNRKVLELEKNTALLTAEHENLELQSNEVMQEYNELKDKMTTYSTDYIKASTIASQDSNLHIDEVPLSVLSINMDFIVANDDIYIPTSFLEEYFGTSEYKIVDSDNFIYLNDFSIIKGIFWTKSHLLGPVPFETVLPGIGESFLSKDITDGYEIEHNEGNKVHTLTSSEFITDRGISIGSTRNDVKNAYGTLGTEDADHWNAVHNNSGERLVFTFEDDIVIKIVWIDQ